MTFDPYRDDLKEYWFANPVDALVHDTLEFRHPAFVEAGAPVAVRIVRAATDIVATLEASAPFQAGQSVTFRALAFALTPPESPERGLPQIDLAIDNATADLMPWLELAAASFAPVELSYRQYLDSDLTAPAYVLHGLTAKRVRGDMVRITGSAGFENLLGRAFPDQIYTLEVYRGLAR